MADSSCIVLMSGAQCDPITSREVTIMLRFMYRSISFAILSFSLAASVAAQRDRDTYNPNNQGFEVSGQVTLIENGTPAQNVPVRLEKFTGGIVDQMDTDSRGRFRFINLVRGYYRVIINAPGLRPAQQDADLQVMSKAYLDFELVSQRVDAMAGLSLAPDVVDVRIPANAREEFALGRSALARKSYPEAVTHLQKAIDSYPEFFAARLLLATAFIDTREWSKAEAALQKTLEIKPNDPTTMIALGEVYWRQHRMKDAEETLLAGLQGDEKSWHGYFTLARLYWDLNEIQKCGVAVGHSLQLKSDFAEAHLLAGNVLLKLNQQERALKSYEEYLRLAPKGEFAAQTKELVQKLQKSITDQK